ncbi:hypothetical protein D3C86_2009660 [compost metagenome]
MDIGKAGQARHLLVEARIVLHRAGAQRIHAGVDRVVEPAEAHIVAHRLGLGKAGQVERHRALEAAEAAGRDGHIRQVDARMLGIADLE